MHNAHLIAHGFIGIGSHTALIPPSVVPGILPHVSVSTLLGLTINAVYSKTVLGPFGIQMVGKDNDSGYFVPHFCIPPPNVLLAVIIPFGSSKVMFSASKVQIDVDGSATPVACCCFPYVPISLNQACNDPLNYPSDVVVGPNSVVVGMTGADLVAGVVNIGVDSAVSGVTSFLGGKAGGAIVDAIGGKIAERMVRESVEELSEQFGREAAESMSRDMVENMLERPAVQVVKGYVSKGVGSLLGSGVSSLTSGEEGEGVTGADGTNPDVHEAE